MANFLDVPITITSERNNGSLTRTLREYMDMVNEINKGEGYTGNFLPEYIEQLIKLIIEHSEFNISKEYAEVIIYNEISEEFGEKAADEVFRYCAAYFDFERELNQSIRDNTFGAFVKQHSTHTFSFNPEDPESFQRSLRKLADEIKSDPKEPNNEVRFRNHTGDNNGPSLN